MIVRHLTPAFSFPDTRSVTKRVQVGAWTFFHHTFAQRPLICCLEGWPLTPMAFLPTSRVTGSSVSVCVKTASSLRQLKNAALFLSLGLPFTLICHKNRAFLKVESENARFLFSCDDKTFWKQSFSKTLTSGPDRVFKHKFKVAGGCYVFKIFRYGEGKKTFDAFSKPVN